MANGSIPSGSAPLYLGSFVSQRGAMAQKMTDRAIQLAEKEQTRQAQERAAMLKALSFDAVQGLGRQVQERHLEELNSLQDKYAKRWIENGRRLTDRDYLDLQRDKTNMEQKIASYKSNVENYAKVADEIRQGKVSYHPSTLEAMRKYYESGNVGEDFTQYIKFMPDTYGFLNKFTPQINRLKPTTKETLDMDRGLVITRGQLSADQVKAALLPMLQNDPQYSALANSDDYTKNALRESVDNYIAQFTQPTYKEEIASDSQLKAEREKQAGAAGGMTNAMYFNDFAKRILSHDKKAIDLLMSKSLTNFGKPDFYEIDKDGGITLYSQADSQGNQKRHYIPPADTDDPDNMRQAMTSVLDLVPATMQGKQKPSDIQSIIDPEYKVEIKEKAPITAVANLQQYLDVPDEKVGTETSTGTKILASKERGEIKGLIERLIPNSKVEVEDPWFGGARGKRPIKVDGVSYNMVNLKDRQELMDKITSSIGIEPIVLQKDKIGEPSKKEETVFVPSSSSPVAAKKDSTSTSADVEAGIQRVMQANGISRDEAIKALKDAGKLKEEPPMAKAPAVDIKNNPIDDSMEEVKVSDANPIEITTTKTSSNKSTVVGGVDIAPYATSEGHEDAVRSTYNSIAEEWNKGVSSGENLNKVIREKIKGHYSVKKAGGSPIDSEMIIKTANKFGVDPMLLAAIIQVDSGYGTTGKAVDTKNPGNIGNDDSGQLVYFPDWQTGLNAVARYLSLPKGKRSKKEIYKGADKIVKPK